MDSGAHSKTTWGRRKRAALPHKGGGCNMADIDDIELTPLEEANLAVAHGTFDALQEGDFERFKSFFAEGSAGWHNFAPWDKPIDVVVDRLKESRAITRTMAYEDRRYIPAPGGAVAKTTMRRIRTDGGRVEMHARSAERRVGNECVIACRAGGP